MEIPSTNITIFLEFLENGEFNPEDLNITFMRYRTDYFYIFKSGILQILLWFSFLVLLLFSLCLLARRRVQALIG